MRSPRAAVRVRQLVHARLIAPVVLSVLAALSLLVLALPYSDAAGLKLDGVLIVMVLGFGLLVVQAVDSVVMAVRRVRTNAQKEVPP